MPITVQQISRRAKEIRKKHPGKKWINCIKEASAQLKSGRAVSAVKKKRSYRQTGSSNKKRDQARSAKAPGKRTVKRADGSSHTYTERRKNRSDKPGKLTGSGIGNAATAYQYSILTRIKSNTHYMSLSTKNIEHYKRLMVGKTATEKKSYKQLIQAEKKNIVALKKDTTMLKRLLK